MAQDQSGFTPARHRKKYFESLGVPGFLAIFTIAAEVGGGTLPCFSASKTRLDSTGSSWPLNRRPIGPGAREDGWLFSNKDGGWEYPAVLESSAWSVLSLLGGRLFGRSAPSFAFSERCRHHGTDNLERLGNMERFLKWAMIAVIAGDALGRGRRQLVPAVPAQADPISSVPFPPGGTLPTSLRASMQLQALGEASGSRFGHRESRRPLAAWVGGTEAAVRSAPTAIRSFHVLRAHDESGAHKLSYDVERDFAPVSLLVSVPQLIAAHTERAGKDAARAGRCGEGASGFYAYASPAAARPATSPRVAEAQRRHRHGPRSLQGWGPRLGRHDRRPGSVSHSSRRPGRAPRPCAPEAAWRSRWTTLKRNPAAP